MKAIISLILVMILLPVTLLAADLTGTWKCSDGGTYYLRQFGEELWWYGEQSPTNPAWSNIAHGTVSGSSVKLNWTDVPKGHIMSHGILQLELTPDGKLVARHKTGGFGGSVWTKSK